MRIDTLCRSRRGPAPAWHDDVRWALNGARSPDAARLREERRERRRVLEEIALLLQRNPFEP